MDELAEMLAEILIPFCEIIIWGINIIAILILLLSLFDMLFRFAKKICLTKVWAVRFRYIRQAKIQVGTYILLTLELLIIADIIESVTLPSMEGLIKLILIVVIRTALSFFLQKEIQHEQQAQDEEDAAAAAATTQHS